MFRFTIRDIVLVTAIVALAVGWWADRRRLVLDRNSAEARSKVLEQKEAEWREANSWLTSALNKEGPSSFGASGSWQTVHPPGVDGR